MLHSNEQLHNSIELFCIVKGDISLPERGHQFALTMDYSTLLIVCSILADVTYVSLLIYLFYGNRYILVYENRHV